MKFSKEELRAAYRRKVLNQELSLKEFAESQVVVKAKPSKAIVELTQNCNFRCIMCPQAYDPKYEKYDKGLNMDLAIFDKIAAAIFPDAYLIDLRGFGESVILPQWPEVLDRLDKYPLINWHLVTNLSLPRDAIWEKMVDQNFALGFSCDGATAETFEKIRVGSRFDRTLHNLELITDRIKSGGRGTLYFIVTVQKQNFHELPEIIELAHRYSVPDVQFKMVRGHLNEMQGETYILTDDDLKAVQPFLDRAVDRAIDHGVRLTVNDQEMEALVSKEKLQQAASIPLHSTPSFPPPGDLDPEFSLEHPWDKIQSAVADTVRVAEHRKCFKANYYTYITCEGLVGTCNHMLAPRVHVMGDLKKQSFDEIWNGDAYQFFRGSLLFGKPTESKCRWCFEHRIAD